ncbi:MAG: AAA family ATPase [Clostridiales bacterium]|nr:AAA family ATPase [Clostridiales bacterium]
MDLSRVYFVIGTSYAGKSTIVKNLAKKHNGIALEENYHDAKLPELDSKEFPNLCYTRDLQDWHEFIRRTPEEYVRWIHDVKKECETVEFQILEELLPKPETQGKLIFVDTNICVDTLHKITDDKHVLVMMSDPIIAISRFFDRPDPEKQFLYMLMLEEPDPQAALDNYREILERLHSKESYDELKNSGYQIIFRDENRTQEETVELAEKIFGI